MTRYEKDQGPKPDRNLAGEPYIEWDLTAASGRVSHGLSTDILDTLRYRLGLSNRELAELLLISPRTLDRRMKEETLPVDESERSYRIARLTDLASDVLGSMDAASDWFREPNYALGNQIPLELIRTEPGARLVERILGQIRYGITV